MTDEISYSRTEEWNLDDIQLSPKLQLELEKIMQAFRQRGCLVGSEFESHELILDEYAQVEYNASKLYDCHIGDCSIGVIIYDVDVANKKVYLFDIGTIFSLESFFGTIEDLPEACQNYINRFIDKAPKTTLAEIIGFPGSSSTVYLKFADKTERRFDLEPLIEADEKLKPLKDHSYLCNCKTFIDEGTTGLCWGDNCQIKFDSEVLYELSTLSATQHYLDDGDNEDESTEPDDWECIEYSHEDWLGLYSTSFESFSDYTMIFRCTGNEVRRIDFKPLIEKDEAFKPLKDLDIFMSPHGLVLNEESDHYNGIWWGEDDEHHVVEIRYKQLYENSVHYTDLSLNISGK